MPRQNHYVATASLLSFLLLMSPAAPEARAQTPDLAHRLSPAHRVSVQGLDLTQAPDEESLIAAGQLGGPLFPTDEPKDRVRDEEDRMAFGQAMEQWNRHEYPAAVALLRRQVKERPDSPWAGEAKLHVACDASYNGRYTEAEALLSELIAEHQGAAHPGAKMLVNKARQRLALLKVEQNNLPAAALGFRELLQASPDWRHRTYASAWLQRLSRFTAAKQALLSCGAEALAYSLEKEGRAQAAANVRAHVPATMRGHTLADLADLARSQGYQTLALELAPADLARLPLPAILHIGAKAEGETGHYWVLDKVAPGGDLELFDPQSSHRFSQSPEELAREWSGHALVFSKGAPVPGRALEMREMESLAGGCCGVPRKEDGPGNPKRNGKKGKNNDPCSKGSPTWQVDVISMNLFLTDTPMWYEPPIGPSVYITLSYNTQSAIAQHEPFGNKWQFSYGTYLVVDTSGTVTVFMPDGARNIYTPDGSGGYLRPYRIFNTLTRVGSNHYELRFPDDTVYVYNIPAGTTSQQPFLTNIRDASGQQISFGYDSKVNLTTITDAQGKVFTLTYDANNKVSRITDPFGRTAAFRYDSALNLSQITDMGGYWTSFTYDSNMYLSSLANAQGTTTFLVEPADNIPQNADNYPPPGDVMYANYRITITDPLGGMEEFFYYGGCDIDGYGCTGYTWYVSPKDYMPWMSQDINNYRLNVPKTRFLQTYAGSGQQGEISQVVYPVGDTLSYVYDPSTGNRTSVTDGNGQTYQYSYNPLGQITSLSDAKHNITRFAFAANGIDLTNISNGLGSVSMGYDTRHHITSVTDRMSNACYAAFDSYGLITSRRDAAGITNLYYYDANHQLTSIARVGKTICSLGYDGFGRVAAITNSSGLVLTYYYNNLDLVTNITYPDGRSEAYEYADCCPRLVTAATDRAGRTARFTYDPLKRLIQVVDAQGSAIHWSYDASGNLLSQTDANGVSTSYTHDADGRLITKTFADGHSISYGYDAAGLVTSRTNASGVVTTYAYDANHNLTTIKYSDATPGVTNIYDDYNRVQAVNDGSGTTACVLDPDSNVTSIDGPWPNDTITLTYDSMCRVTNLVVQGGVAAGYAFDAMNRLASARLDDGAYAWSYSGVSPCIQGLARPNGSYTTNAYDLLNRMTLISNRKSNGQVVGESRYTYNSQDRCDSETVSNAPASSPGQARVVGYTYANANQLMSATPPNQVFLSDADGNLIRGVTPDGTVFGAAYDAENRLKSVNLTNAAGAVYRTEFIYSGEFFVARRVDYVNGVVSNDTRYIRLGALALQERDGNNAVKREYAWRGTGPGGVGELLRVRQGGQNYQCLYNARGDVMSLLDASQNTVASYDYGPFGLLLATVASVDQPMRFCTKAYDENTGLLDFGYRFFAPTLARWLSRDPAGEYGGLNLYQYAGDNPFGAVDPLGLFSATLSGYLGVGGKVTIGQNPDGSWFVGGGGGLGTGGGFSFDPNGKMPGYRKTKGPCGQVSIGFYGEAGVGAGPVKLKTSDKAGVNISGSADSIIDVQGYSSDPVNVGNTFAPKAPSLDMGASFSYGLEVYVSED